MTSNSYEIWLTYDGEREKIQLPVLPPSFKVKNGSNNDKVNIAGLGEIVIMQSRPALQFSWSCFFPAATFPGVKAATLVKPLELVKTINRWKASKQPIHLIATACGVDLYASIEKFDYHEDGGDPGTYQYDISLKEYREIAVRQVEVNIAAGTATVQGGETRVDNTVKPQTYTVKGGDCLWNIAKKYYGSGSQYTKIRDANAATIAKHKGGPNMIWPGDVLTIP